MHKRKYLLIGLAAFAILAPIFVQPVAAGHTIHYWIDHNIGGWNAYSNQLWEEDTGWLIDHYDVEVVFWFDVPDYIGPYRTYNHHLTIDYEGWMGETLFVYYRWGTSGYWTHVATLNFIFGEVNLRLYGKTSTTLQVMFKDNGWPDWIQSVWLFGDEPYITWQIDPAVN